MMNDFNHLSDLPGPPEYQAWVKNRLETLSVRESYVLAAVLQRAPPRDAEEAADCLNSLEDYDVCPAGSYEELGRFYLQQLKTPEDVLPYADLGQLGQMYEAQHPGLFIGSYYVVYPKQSSSPVRQENGVPLLWDDSWSAKLKLASPAVPEGVWLRLPDHDGNMAEHSTEVRLALDALRLKSLEDCTILEAKCILPEAGDLMAQYDSVTELVRDSDNLGFVMEEQGQGGEHWLEKFAAALEYENCRTLKFALDIAQNLRCYDWISCEDLEISAEGLLLDAGVPVEIINSGCIDLRAYQADLLETSGYMQASGDTGYLRRNNWMFFYEYSNPDAPEMTIQ